MKRDPGEAQWLKTSLEVGDHRVPERRALWAGLAFAVATSSALVHFRKPDYRSGIASTVVYVSNPTGHGIRFVGATVSALDDGHVEIWCDERLDQGVLGTKKDFPSIAPRSIARHIGWRHLRLLAPNFGRGGDVLDVGTEYSRLYWRYLLFAQRVRYALAIEHMSNSEVKILLADMDRNSGCAPVVMAAKHLGITTATLVHGCPSRHYLPILSDHVLAWSTVQRDWFKDSGVSCDIHIVGRPDISFPTETSTGGRIVFAHSREVLTDHEMHRLQALLIQAGKLGKTRSLRLHPQARSFASEGNWTEMSFDNIEIADGGLAWLTDCELLVTVSSTTAIDALSFGVPCMVVADPDRELPCELEHLRVMTDQSGSANNLTHASDTYIANARAAILPLIGVDAAMRLSDVISQIAKMSDTVNESRD
jgi:hypothetical protein